MGWLRWLVLLLVLAPPAKFTVQPLQCLAPCLVRVTYRVPGQELVVFADSADGDHQESLRPASDGTREVEFTHLGPGAYVVGLWYAGTVQAHADVDVY